MPAAIFKRTVFKINNHSHLYNTQIFVSPAATRSYEQTLPTDNHNAHIGIPTVKANNSRAIGHAKMRSNVNAGGVSTMSDFVDTKLTNRDVYQKMKNKAIYGKSESIRAHANLNKL